MSTKSIGRDEIHDNIQRYATEAQRFHDRMTKTQRQNVYLHCRSRRDMATAKMHEFEALLKATA